VTINEDYINKNIDNLLKLMATGGRNIKARQIGTHQGIDGHVNNTTKQNKRRMKIHATID